MQGVWWNFMVDYSICCSLYYIPSLIVLCVLFCFSCAELGLFIDIWLKQVKYVNTNNHFISKLRWVGVVSKKWNIVTKWKRVKNANPVMKSFLNHPLRCVTEIWKVEPEYRSFKTQPVGRVSKCLLSREKGWSLFRFAKLW